MRLNLKENQKTKLARVIKKRKNRVMKKIFCP